MGQTRIAKEMIIYWVVPPPSNSHHQDYYIFRIGNPNLNLHLPLLLRGGVDPNYIAFFVGLILCEGPNFDPVIWFEGNFSEGWQMIVLISCLFLQSFLKLQF